MLTVVLTLLMIIATIPLSVFAAPAAGISKEMLDNEFIDALEYTGYNVEAQKNDGSIFAALTFVYSDGIGRF